MAKNDPSKVVPIAPIASSNTGSAIAGLDPRRNFMGSVAEGATSAVDIAAQITESTSGIPDPTNAADRARDKGDDTLRLLLEVVEDELSPLGEDDCNIRSTTRGIACPKHKRLMKTGIAHEAFIEGNSLDQLAR
mmetsp:Transcript_14734/g.20829  ORF Transcript_14734/g.20829 Transcript_14734/m.20829 type:complete len:134 (+) Transcript_14734:476-877(+)